MNEYDKMIVRIESAERELIEKSSERMQASSRMIDLIRSYIAEGSAGDMPYLKAKLALALLRSHQAVVHEGSAELANDRLRELKDLLSADSDLRTRIGWPDAFSEVSRAQALEFITNIDNQLGFPYRPAQKEDPLK